MHIIYALDVGGMQKGLSNLINMMDPLFVNSICCITKAGIFKEKIKKQGIEIFELNKKEGNDFSSLIKLVSLLRKKKVDIVHARCWGALFDAAIAAKIAKIPVVIYGEHGRRYEDVFHPKKRQIWLRKILLTYFVDKIVAVSTEVKEWLQNSIGIKQDKIICIHNGIDPKEAEIEINLNKRKQIGIQNGEIVIGTIGRLDPVKDYSTLIYAASEIINQFPNVGLLFVGDGPMRNDLENLGKNLHIENKIMFLGERTDTIELLKMMDIFVLPSLIEGISNTILEAMSCGIPVVATNVGGNPEVVINGETGFLVPPKDSHALAEAIREILKDRSKGVRLGLAGKERTNQHFSLTNMVKAYETLYKTMAEKYIGGK